MLLAVIGVTILRIGQLLSVHLFVGMLLIGPVLLKMGSTGYRFLRYTLQADYSPSAALTGDVTGRFGRMLALGAALLTGVVLAILVIPDFGPWLHGSELFHHHG